MKTEVKAIIQPESEDTKTINDFEKRLDEAITSEGDDIRRKTEQASAPIIAKSRQEYKRKIVTFVEKEVEGIRKKAEIESSAIISKAVQERICLSRKPAWTPSASGTG